MRLSKGIFLLLYLLLWPESGLKAQSQAATEKKQTAVIDSICIKRNWRTRDRIILAELEFGTGDEVSFKTIQTSMDKVWNTGNFATLIFREMFEHLPVGGKHTCTGDETQILAVL